MPPSDLQSPRSSNIRPLTYSMGISPWALRKSASTTSTRSNAAGFDFRRSGARQSLFMQRQRDRAAGLDTAGFVSGYRGSPLGGLDLQLMRNKGLLDESDIVFEPGLNEDLAATAVWGSQQANALPGATKDGVFGMWYGKGPGVDRSGDALKHANNAGSSPVGALAVFGDDHPANPRRSRIKANTPSLVSICPSCIPLRCRNTSTTHCSVGLCPAIADCGSALSASTKRLKARPLSISTQSG